MERIGTKAPRTDSLAVYSRSANRWDGVVAMVEWLESGGFFEAPVAIKCGDSSPDCKARYIKNGEAAAWRSSKAEKLFAIKKNRREFCEYLFAITLDRDMTIPV